MDAGALVMNGHLGGYLAGGDPATYFPALWTWLVDELGVASVIDVGCGDGVAVRYFDDELGIDAVGVEGVPQPDPRIIEHDYTTGPLLLDAEFDLCWSCEFVEHVEEQYVPNFLATFARGRMVLMTHGTPGQPGFHHVNCQERGYWIAKLGRVGFDLDEQLTVSARILAAANTNAWNHFVRSGLAFRGRG